MPRAFKADPAALYFTDNGAVLCGEHLGTTAAYTGRDISGQPIQRVSLADVREYHLNGCDIPDICCEVCTKQFVGADPRPLAQGDVIVTLRIDGEEKSLSTRSI